MWGASSHLHCCCVRWVLIQPAGRSAFSSKAYLCLQGSRPLLWPSSTCLCQAAGGLDPGLQCSSAAHRVERLHAQSCSATLGWDASQHCRNVWVTCSPDGGNVSPPAVQQGTRPETPSTAKLLEQARGSMSRRAEGGQADKHAVPSSAGSPALQASGASISQQQLVACLDSCCISEGQKVAHTLQAVGGSSAVCAVSSEVRGPCHEWVICTHDAALLYLKGPLSSGA